MRRKAMSISATRRVSGSPRTDRNYTVSSGHGESFVENIDTSNNVFINDDVRNDDNRKQRSKQQFQDEKEQEKNTSSAGAYVPNAIEAIAASGVYDNNTDNTYHSSKNIGVYDNNQSYVQEDNHDKLPQSYLKHFYENNQPPEEVDELV